MKFQDNTHEKGNGIAVTITIHQAKLSCDEAELLSGVACGLLWERSLFFGFTYRYCLLPLGLSRRQTFSSGKVIRLNFFYSNWYFFDTMESVHYNYGYC